MLTDDQRARLRLLAHSSFYPDILALLEDFRASASLDLESAVDHVKVYRSQGSVMAFDLVANEMHRLRTAPPTEADKQNSNLEAQELYG